MTGGATEWDNGAFVRNLQAQMKINELDTHLQVAWKTYSFLNGLEVQQMCKTRNNLLKNKNLFVPKNISP